MTAALLAEYTGPSTLVAAMDAVERKGFRVLDTFTPYPIEELSTRLPTRPSPVRPAMLIAGFCAAAMAYGLQVYSSIWAYPLDSGGRPLHSWPVFLLVPFEVGVLAAAVAGIIAFFVACGLPRLHQPLFAVPGFERASQDRYFLLARASDDASDIRDLRSLLEQTGALVVTAAGTP